MIVSINVKKLWCSDSYLQRWQSSGRKIEDTQNEIVKIQVFDPAPGKMIWNTSGVWGPSKDGGLNEQKVRDTRDLVKGFTDFSQSFKDVLVAEALKIGMDGNATLAVHLRLTDKVHDESKENAGLSNEMVS